MNTSDKRLLTLYTFDSFASSITREQMSTLLINTTHLDWIESQLIIESLLKDGLLISNHKDNKISLSPEGKEIVKIYGNTISHFFRNAIKEYIHSHKEDLLRETLSQSDFSFEGDHFKVNLRLVENSNNLLTMSLLVPNREIAEKICDNWKSHSSIIYRKLLEDLSTDEKTDL